MLDLIHWHSLDARDLGPGSTILDLGANNGDFARKMHGRFGARIIAVEPNPRLFAGLKGLPFVTAFNAAISQNDDEAHFIVDEQNDLASRLVDRPEPGSIVVRTMTLGTVLAEAGADRIDLLKIDIEGAEIDLLLETPAETLRSIGQITVEIHDFCGLTPPADVARVIERMRDLGFHVARMSRVGHQDTWMGNTAHRNIGIGDRVAIAALKYWRGLGRIARKAIHGDRWHQAYD